MIYNNTTPSNLRILRVVIPNELDPRGNLGNYIRVQFLENLPGVAFDSITIAYGHNSVGLEYASILQEEQVAHRLGMAPLALQNPFSFFQEFSRDLEVPRSERRVLSSESIVLGPSQTLLVNQVTHPEIIHLDSYPLTYTSPRDVYILTGHFMIGRPLEHVKFQQIYAIRYNPIQVFSIDNNDNILTPIQVSQNLILNELSDMNSISLPVYSDLLINRGISVNGTSYNFRETHPSRLFEFDYLEGSQETLMSSINYLINNNVSVHTR